MNINKDHYAALAAIADDRWNDEELTKPKSKSWGFYAYGDAPAAIGGGIGSYVWFKSKSAMLIFIEEVLPFSPPGPSTSDCDEVAKLVADTCQKLRKSEIKFEDGQRILNKVLKSYSQFEWMGAFQDFKSGKTTYARKIILDFRRQNNLKISTKPISVDRSELYQFKDYLYFINA